MEKWLDDLLEERLGCLLVDSLGFQSEERLVYLMSGQPLDW